MTIGTANNGGIQLAYETIGGPEGQPLLLIMGTAGQMLSWPDGFCRGLVDRGFNLARFDNRDSGLSTHLTDRGAPNQLRMLLRPASAAAYRLDDMAGDAIAVLDDLGWRAAHIVGVSQGGMIAQVIATKNPDRTLSLTSISSSPAPRLGQPGPRALAKIVRVANPKRVKTADDLGQYLVDMQQIVGSPAYPADEARLRDLGRRSYERGGLDVAAVQRQTAAIAASGDRREVLGTVRVPTVVLHGEDDHMIRSIAGKATADAIPGARYVSYPGMGHELPPPLWKAIIDEIAAVARIRAESPTSE
jgi:pimeloyl-ACP methyl ester carboxylesterase